MGGLKRWVQAACRSSVKAIPCGKSCFGIIASPSEQPQEEKTIQGERELRSKLDSSFTMYPCKKCEEPIGDEPSPLHCPAPAGHHNYSLDCSVQGEGSLLVCETTVHPHKCEPDISGIDAGTIMPLEFPLEVPEMEFHDSQSVMDENDWGALSTDVRCLMYDPETPMRSSLSWPALKQRDSINLPDQVNGGQKECDSRIHQRRTAVFDIERPEPPPGLYSTLDYDNEKENTKGGNGDDIAGWGGEPRGRIQGQGKRYKVPKLMLTPGKGSSILSSYEPHSVRDNNAYESSEDSWRSHGDGEGHETVSNLQLALYKKSIGNSLISRLPGGVNSSESCLPPCDGDKESESDGEERLVGNVFHQLFQVEGVGINDQGLVWDRSSCESWDTDSRAKTTTSGRPTCSTSSRAGSSCLNAWSRAKSGSGKSSSMCQMCGHTWMDRSINWITCGKASFDRDVDNFVKHPRENIHRHANAARGAARYQRRQKVLVNRIEATLKEGQSNCLKNAGAKTRSGNTKKKPEATRVHSCSEIDSASREGILWPQLRKKNFFTDPQRVYEDSFVGGPSCQSQAERTGNEMHPKEIAMPLTTR